MKRNLVLCILMILSVACGGEFEDELYEDEYYEDGFAEPLEDEGAEAAFVPEEDEPAEEETTLDELAEDVQTGGGAEEAYFESADCPFDLSTQYGVTCGYLTVPENRQTGSATTIELAVAILPARQGNGAADPVIYLDGGPGSSALASLEAEPDAWAEYGFAQTRDTIFIDQRGTGFSRPTLNCPEMDDDFEGLENELDCLDRLLDEGIDVTAYNTAENAADVAALARALGLDSYNLLGISYGTRLALAVMRDHPAGIRSVVLDSPFPPNADPAANEAALAYDRMVALFTACEQDGFCSGEYPDLEDVFIETVELMNDNPPSEFINGDLLVETIYQALFAGEEYVTAVPLLIYLSYEEDYSFLEELSEELLGGYSRRTAAMQDGDNDGDSEGMYTSVMCRDEYAFSTLPQLEDRTADGVPTPIQSGLSGSGIELFELCAEWGAGMAAPQENAPVTSDIPTLILVGEYDPATPPVWGEITAQTLANDQLYIMPNGGHSLLSGNQCAIDLTNSFLADPLTELDDRCVGQTDPLEFE